MAVSRRDRSLTDSGSMNVEIVAPPGTYGDGPVHLRVHRAAAGAAWPVPGYHREPAWPLGDDPEYDYVGQENSHSAHVRLGWLRERGLPGDAANVVVVIGVRAAPRFRAAPR